MSFETQLKSHYAATHQRLLHPLKQTAKPKIKTIDIPPTVELDPCLSPPSTPNRLFVLRRLVSEKTGISIQLLSSPRRQRPITDARQIFYFLCHYYTKATLEQIGLAVGGKDHTTVLHGVRAIQDLVKKDLWWRYYIGEFAIIIERFGDFGDNSSFVGECPFCHSDLTLKKKPAVC